MIAPETPGARRALVADVVAELCRFRRPSASAGEQRAATLIRDRLDRIGHPGARVEFERAHGSLWLPILAVSAAALLGSIRGGRSGGALCLLAAVAAVDDLEGDQRMRRLLPRRRTANVVAEIPGRIASERLVVVLAHHDAARSGVLFHPRLLRLIARPFIRMKTTPPLMWPVVAAPALGFLGCAGKTVALRRIAALTSATVAALMLENASGEVVPGANDNLSGVATLMVIAEALASRPLETTDVLLVSTGAEEAGLEGARGFFARHRDELRRRQAKVICVDTVGARDLTLIGGEGTLRVRPYSADLRARVRAAAEALGYPGIREISFRGATDGAVARKHGFDAVAIASLDGDSFPSTYHWPTDRPESLDQETIADAASVCLKVIEGIDRR